MIKYAFVERDRVTSVVTPSDAGLYKDRETYQGLLCVAVAYEIPNETILKMRYYRQELITLPEPPALEGYYYDYKSASWGELSLENYPEEFESLLESKKRQFKAALDFFMVDTCKFPLSKQVDWLEHWTDLSIKKLSGTITLEEQEHLTQCREVKLWRTKLKKETSIVSEKLGVSESLTEVNLIMEALDYPEPPFPL